MRPIAVGMTWRRLAAKVCVHQVSERATTLLAPRQLGFGMKGGQKRRRMPRNDILTPKLPSLVHYRKAYC